MSIKFEKIIAGMTLLDIHKVRAGNSRVCEWGCWKVKVVSVDFSLRTAIVSWNGNTPVTWREDRLAQLYREGKEPKVYREYLERRARRGGRVL